jgi:hypothetical protein
MICHQGKAMSSLFTATNTYHNGQNSTVTTPVSDKGREKWELLLITGRLVGIKNRVATLKDSRTISYKTKHLWLKATQKLVHGCLEQL